ncbi:MAG: putative sulfate exporter family transporter [Candidatus Methanomethylophilaceae archaeon]|nr:putative sulfate exporter family transporter [Candidatus Methanomethylophilaceae archaeon]
MSETGSEKEPVKYRFVTEDNMAMAIGFIIIAIAAVSVITGAFDFAAAKFATWGKDSGLLEQFDAAMVGSIVRTLLVYGVLFSGAVLLMRENVKKYLPAFLAVFVLALLVRIISAEYTMNRYLEWAFFAIIIGLLISNTVGTPEWMKPAIKTELYIKTGLVIMGFSVLFSKILNFGLYGIGIAWGVTPIVIIVMWILGTRVFKMKDEATVITMAAATSVCGTSAAIATGAASGIKKSDLSLVVSISILATVLMMAFEPIIIDLLGLSPIMGGALIGGTIDSTGAVAVAGTALGEEAQTAAVLVKSIQNILIGFIAFAVAVYFASRGKGDAGAKVGVSEIWRRFPKFVIGFFVASIVASFLVQPMFGLDTVNSINKVLDQYKNWAFILAFLSIGLETNFRELRSKLSGGAPLKLYVCGQAFNIVLTFIVVWFLLSGTFFPIPEL